MVLNHHVIMAGEREKRHMQEVEESQEDLSNDEWVKVHFEDLIQQYPRKWIVVMERKVVTSGGIRYFVERKAKQMADEKEYSIYFIPPTSTRTDATYQTH
jgi:hypothetical protein